MNEIKQSFISRRINKIEISDNWEDKKIRQVKLQFITFIKVKGSVFLPTLYTY